MGGFIAVGRREMGDLTFDGWRRTAAKRPIETKEQRSAWLCLCECWGLTSSDLANMCGVSRQTASGWLNKPESTLPWARFEQVARLTLERKIAAISEAYEQGGKVWRFRVSDEVGKIQHIVDTITGRSDEEREALKELGACIDTLMIACQHLDEERREALVRVALDMLAAQHAEREGEQD